MPRICGHAAHGGVYSCLQRVDRVEAGAAQRREEAEAQADRRGKTDGQQDHRGARAERDRQRVGRRAGQPEAERDADQPAEQRQHRRLDQELHEDVPLMRADGQPDADLARALGHRDQHDVHDADAADQQADGGDRAEHAGHHIGGAGHGVGDLRHVAHREIVVAVGRDVARLAQDVLHPRLHDRGRRLHRRPRHRSSRRRGCRRRGAGRRRAASARHCPGPGRSRKSPWARAGRSPGSSSCRRAPSSLRDRRRRRTAGARSRRAGRRRRRCALPIPRIRGPTRPSSRAPRNSRCRCR